jgi:hypothetical protein
MEWLKKIWKILNGNKTLICTSLLALLEKFPIIPEPYKTIIITILTVLGGASLIHHVQKGYFTPEKGH